MVEFSLYNKLEKHFLAKMESEDEAIVTDPKVAVYTLNSLCAEMENRLELCKKAAAKNIVEYNDKFLHRRLNPENGHRFLPYIVVVIDEFADLIMTAGKEVEHPIARIAQLARAVGIHLIIATQRPSVNIITGTIKANFPARIAFRVTSKIDSRTILDTGGADQLIGRGDMLLSSGSEIVRLQCALIDTEEIEKVAEFIGSQRGYPDCFLLPEYLDEESEPNKEFDPKQKDEYFEEAARLVVTSQHGSTSLLQRKLQLGYNRAGRIIDQLEAAGIVGPFEGSKAREVLIKTEAELKEHLKNMTH
jgi:S-DNA-T family DNA segregation ATPase FtsK/SpoIIIE